jgi:mono/diheme cytochrome c family protein
MTMLSGGIQLAFGSLALCIASAAGAQESLDKNKTGPQLYASYCVTCHKSPQNVTKFRGKLALETFISEHYPATPESAAAIAAYLEGLEKRSAGSSRHAAKRMSQAKPPELPPSESEENEPTMQRALKRLLQAIKPENN